MNLRLDNSSDVIHEHTYEVDVTFLYVFAGLNLAIDRVRRIIFSQIFGKSGDPKFIVRERGR